MVLRVLNKKIWPYQVNLQEKSSSADIEEIEAWLVKKLGPHRDRWNVIYYYDQVVFYFKEGSDATMFSLRWG